VQLHPGRWCFHVSGTWHTFWQILLHLGTLRARRTRFARS
jgi:hypothetical protein